MRSWLVKDARAHLSELMEAALDGEPQRVTRRGKGAVVVVGEDDWARLTARASRGRARSFGEHLAKFPLSREEWDAVAPKRAGMTSVPASGSRLVPRHSGFDWLGVTENGQVLGGAEHLDAARDAWLAADMAEALQREDHLVHGRRGELEMALHVGLGRGTAVDAGIGVDEGQVLPLPLGELFADIATRSIHLRLSRRRGKMNIRYRVELSEAERSELGSLLRGGQHAARKLKRAQILLAADAGVPDETIAQSLGVGGSTVYRTKRHFVEGTLGEALHEEPRPGARRKLTGQEEALLVATACSRPPEGRARWTSELH